MTGKNTGSCAGGNRRAPQPIGTVQDAIDFLLRIGLGVLHTVHGWIIFEINSCENSSELTCDSEVELIDFARSEYNRFSHLSEFPGSFAVADSRRRTLFTLRTDHKAPKHRPSEKSSAGGNNKAKEVKR